MPLPATAEVRFSETMSLPENELTPSVLYKLIASEVALQKKQSGVAYKTLMELAASSKDPRIAQRAFEIADLLNAYKEALAAAKLWVELDKNNVDANTALILTNWRMGHLTTESRLTYNQLLSSVSDSAKQQKLLSNAIVQVSIGAQSPQKALDFLKPMLSKRAYKEDVALAMGKLYRQIGNRTEALRLSQIAYRDMPDNTSALLEYVDNLFTVDAAKAIDVLTLYLRKYPNDLDAQIGLCKAYAKNRQSQLALEQLRRVEELAPENPAVLFSLAGVSEAIGAVKDAQRLLEKFVQFVPQNSRFSHKLPHAHLALGLYLQRQKQYAQAIVHLEKVGNDSSLAVEAAILRAECLHALGETSKALKLLDSFEELQDKAEIYTAQARLFEAQNKTKQAFSYWEKALKQDPENAAILYQTALAADALKKDRYAEKLLRQGIELFPQQAIFYNALGYLWVDKGIRLDEAKVLLDKALKLAPNDPTILDSMGWLHFQLKDYLKALGYLEDAARDSMDLEIWLHLAETYHAMGQTQTTMKLLRTILKRAPESEKEIERFRDRLKLNF